MIANATGYKYLFGDDIDAAHPHGDLDRISITGSNCAVAGGPIYGEPVAWVMECLLARKAAFDWYQGSPLGEFTRVISGYQIERTANTFNSMNSYPFVKPSQLNGARTFGYIDSIRDVPNAFWGTGESVTVEVPKSGDPVKAGPVDDMTKYMHYFARGVMVLNSSPRTMSFDGMSLDGEKYEVGGYVAPPPSQFDGGRLIWCANGFGQLNMPIGEIHHEGWCYYFYDYRLKANSTIVIHADEEKLRHLDYVRPVFDIWLNQYLQYSDTGYVYNENYHSIVVGGNTYRFDANGDVRIMAYDALSAFTPPTRRRIENPSGAHEDAAYYYMRHEERIENIWLVGSLKSDVVDN